TRLLPTKPICPVSAALFGEACIFLKGLVVARRYLGMTIGPSQRGLLPSLATGSLILTTVLRFLALIALLPMALSLSATDRVECGCVKTGSYVGPLIGAEPAVIPTSFNSGTSPSGIYTVTSTVQWPVVYVTVMGTSRGGVVLQRVV